MNQLCFEGGMFSRRVVDKIGLPDARFFIYGDDACYGYVASQHFPAAVVADVVLKRARAVSNWDIAGKRQLNSTSDTNRYYIMRNRGFLARYMQIYGDYDPGVDALGLELLAVQALLDIERDGIDDIRVPRPAVGRMRWGFGFDGQRVSWCVNDCSGGRKPFTTRCPSGAAWASSWDP